MSSSWRPESDASSPALAARFHAALRSADVSTARALAFRFPSVVRARDPAPGGLGAPPLVSAAISSPWSAGRRRAERCAALVELLAARGASLRAKDERRRHALLAAGEAGAHPLVVARLAELRAMAWSDADVEGRTALELASVSGHGKLAAFALDELLTETEREKEQPFKLLRLAVEGRDEKSAMDLLRAKSVQRAVVQDKPGVESAGAHGQWSQVEQRRDESLQSCVAAAVENGMSRLVTQLHALNPDRVGRAAWLTVHRLRTTQRPTKKPSRRKLAAATKIVFPTEILRVVELHRQQVEWQSVRFVFLARNERVRVHLTQRSRDASAAVLVAMLIDLPDDAFRIVVGFLKTPFNDDSEAQKEQFRVLVEDAW